MKEFRFSHVHKLEKQIKTRIWNKLQECKEDPFRFLEPLIEIEGFKLRVGDYRLIIDVDHTNKFLKILKVGHRKNVYE
ncbi:type II toxin-antitoxin system RelE/ParE family toxin [Candidatus Woesearchaeota archaeon]|nr:type II toxin-antitoxin system RelE/ParE family toxin [Candidatus Woesearchaeota archaeon]